MDDIARSLLAKQVEYGHGSKPRTPGEHVNPLTNRPNWMGPTIPKVDSPEVLTHTHMHGGPGLYLHDRKVIDEEASFWLIRNTFTLSLLSFTFILFPSIFSLLNMALGNEGE